ncbi:hypothetical protein GQ44DRAFT_755237 [Phaeosphaeriaceae sp. PMI808]|nr:hypothetical protein GQ44DRAFT_755237 [Phaeosphaeriaceae sp. PMI808]
MDTLLPIADLTPSIPERDSKLFKAAVTLIWPYSSSQREFALLLAEPEFRLRRKKGQVRVRFTGSSAKALATTGVGIGDEVVLSLKGAEFVKEGLVSTPGRSIDWELEYRQTVIVHVFRGGQEIASLDVVDVVGTPAPTRSPVRRGESGGVTSPMQQWKSPAFLKRMRLSDGPFFEAPYGSLADGEGDVGGHDKKRRRKSYRDWKAWTYNARTPSPEKDDASGDEEFDMDASPSRPTQLPDTPVSPQEPEIFSVAAGPLSGAHDGDTDTDEQEEEQEIDTGDLVVEDMGGKASLAPAMEDFVRDEEYYDLYAGPDEFPPADARYAFGGDTEVNTEVDEDTEDASESQPHGSAHLFLDGAAEVITEANSLTEEFTDANATESTVESPGFGVSEPVTLDPFGRPEEVPALVMPPPILPALNTTFLTPVNPGISTPIGMEPASPTLQPIDSALLPLPSPFPGASDGALTPFLDHVSHSDQPVLLQALEEFQPPPEADYVLENSFFSSISSSKTYAFHPDHESAFTPVRFTFGMDSAGWSKPLEVSSPAQQGEKDGVDVDLQVNAQSVICNDSLHSHAITEDKPFALSASPKAQSSTTKVSLSDNTTQGDIQEHTVESFRESGEGPEVIELLSDSEEAEGGMDGVDKAAAGSALLQEIFVHDAEFVSTTDIDPSGLSHEALLAPCDEQEDVERIRNEDQDTVQAHTNVSSTQESAAASVVVDLGSPSEGSSDIEETLPEPPKYNLDVGDPIEEKMTDQDLMSLDNEEVHTSTIESNSEFIAMDPEPANLDLVTDTLEQAVTHTSTQQEMETVPETEMDSQHDVTQDEESLGVMQQDKQIEEHHPDIKMESIEEDSIFLPGETDTQGEQNTLDEAFDGPPGQILIEVPEGHKLGKLHTIAVPVTGPARNTRSKTKISMSPAKEAPSILKRTAKTKSPKLLRPQSRERMSTMSPSQEATQTSPYSLRSQSKLHSPTKGTFIPTSAKRQTSRKHSAKLSVESIPDIASSQLQDPDTSMPSFELPQEFSASQGKYSNVSFVKDSEEESIRSDTLSTVKYSDDWNVFTNLSDPMVPGEEDHDTAKLKPPPATAPEAGAGVERKLSGRRGKHKLLGPSPIGLPSRNSHQLVVRVDDSAQQALRNPPRFAETFSHESTPKANRVALDATLPGEGEAGGIQSRHLSLTPVDLGENMRSSPPASAQIFTSINQQSNMGNNSLITPEPSQQLTLELKATFTTDHQYLPMTPQLTQATSTDLHSFEEKTQADDTATKTPTQTSCTPKTKSPKAPTIGLSTPLAYYTPLSSLPYFLNRPPNPQQTQTPTSSP